MAFVGQLVYNLEAYDSEGSLISTNGLNIYDNLFKTGNALAGFRLTKLGIQAPPGTIIYIGTTDDGEQAQRIMIGRNGIYEIDDEQIRIQYLRFEKQYKWVLDETGTNNRLTQGETQLSDAKSTFDTNVANLDINAKDYWERYNEIFQDYISDYDKAYGLYIQGINGVYAKIAIKDASGEVVDYVTIDPKNIIIDYVFETEAQNKSEGGAN